jgi:hypothetical protein
VDGFAFDDCEAFTFSMGFLSVNRLCQAGASGSVNIRAVYAIDTRTFDSGCCTLSARKKQYASGTAGALVPRFEHLPLGPME